MKKNHFKTDLLICGAGPTGLGAAWRIEELKGEHKLDTDWCMIEASDGPGGMATSAHEDGFIWDIGGHVLFSHYNYFDKLLNDLVNEWNNVVPIRGAWMRDRFVPFPVQRNIHRLPEDECNACLEGLRDVANSAPSDNGNTLKDYLLANFGTGLYKSFLEPLNSKMWAADPSKMSHVWTSARSGSSVQNVPSADYERIKNNIKENKDDPAWDEDTTIKYPRQGGTGSIWNGLASRLPKDKQIYNTRISSINSAKKKALLDNGQTVQYDNLITSMPIDTLLRSLIDRPDLGKLANEFQPAAVDIVGLGISGPIPKALEGVCFLYVPESDLPFWRLTMLSNYSPEVAPTGAWSILCEINSSRDRNKPQGDIVSAVITGLTKLGFLENPKNVMTQWHRSLTHGYPVPLVNRDAVLDKVQSKLEAVDILSRGRFGAWKYEESNQDHAFMQGVDAVDSVYPRH